MSSLSDNTMFMNGKQQSPRNSPAPYKSLMHYLGTSADFVFLGSVTELHPQEGVLCLDWLLGFVFIFLTWVGGEASTCLCGSSVCRRQHMTLPQPSAWSQELPIGFSWSITKERLCGNHFIFINYPSSGRKLGLFKFCSNQSVTFPKDTYASKTVAR